MIYRRCTCLARSPCLALTRVLPAYRSKARTRFAAACRATPLALAQNLTWHRMYVPLSDTVVQVKKFKKALLTKMSGVPSPIDNPACHMPTGSLHASQPAASPLTLVVETSCLAVSRRTWASPRAPRSPQPSCSRRAMRQPSVLCERVAWT